MVTSCKTRNFLLKILDLPLMLFWSWSALAVYPCNQSINQPSSWSINQSTIQLINQSIKLKFDWLIDQSIKFWPLATKLPLVYWQAKLGQATAKSMHITGRTQDFSKRVSSSYRVWIYQYINSNIKGMSVWNCNRVLNVFTEASLPQKFLNLVCQRLLGEYNNIICNNITPSPPYNNLDGERLPCKHLHGKLGGVWAWPPKKFLNWSSDLTIEIE